MAKIDTVGDNYYKPLRRADAVAGWIFWIISGLSLGILFVEKAAQPAFHSALQIIFLVLALLVFILGMVQRLYLSPRAEDKRRQQFLSDGFGVSLTSETTEGYYNNGQKNPFRRLAANAMESAFFTGELVRIMLATQRAKTVGYLVVYVVAFSLRSTNLELLTVVAQVLFSEDIISRWLRMEWLRVRSEKVYEDSSRLFLNRATFSGVAAQAQAVELFALYETTKARAGIEVSSKVFEANNSRLTKEWNERRATSGL